MHSVKTKMPATWVKIKIQGANQSGINLSYPKGTYFTTGNIYFKISWVLWMSSKHQNAWKQSKTLIEFMKTSNWM